MALYEALRHVADVEVMAPEVNNSAKSNALTLHSPLYVQQAAIMAFATSTARQRTAYTLR